MTQAAPQNRESDDLAQARKLLADGSVEQALSVAKQYWLENEDSCEVARLIAEIMADAGQPQLAKKLIALVKDEASLPGAEQPGQNRSMALDFSQPLPIFEAGFAMIDARQFALASMLLKRCAQLSPDDPDVNYELGFALMSIGNISEAINYFQRAMKERDDFDTTLNLSVCYVLRRDIVKARQQTLKLAKLAKEDDEIKECSHRKIVLRRLETVIAKKTFNRQDWLYVLYGGVLLSADRQLEQKEEDTKNIAKTLLILRGLLEGIREEPEVIEYYNVKSRPLAKILSELMEIPMDSFKGPNRPDQSLLVIDWATDIIGPHENFIDNDDRRIIFAYALPYREPLPLVPDIVGCFAEQPIMPWNESIRNESMESLCEKIIERTRDLETDPDIFRAIQDTLVYYEPKRESIFLNNVSVFPARPEYTAEIQL